MGLGKTDKIIEGEGGYILIGGSQSGNINDFTPAIINPDGSFKADPKTIGFGANANISTSINTNGAITTIIETDGSKTLTTVIDKTNPLSKTIISTWS